jgi:putative ABC transport system permease protein
VPALSRLASLWRNLFHKARVERDLDEEVRAYVALLAEEKSRAGMSPDAALRAARMEAGGIEQVKEEVRDVRAGVLLDTFLQDLRYAARTLVKNPGFTLVAVLTLALGIGANTAIFSVLYGVLLRPLPYPDAGRLVGLSDVYLGNRGERAITYREFRLLQTDSGALERSAVWTSVGLNLFAGGAAERVDGLRVSEDYFRVLGVGMALGRDFVADEDQPGGPNVAVLSHGLWERRFGADRSIVGRPVSIDGAPYTVVGVLPATFRPLEPADVYSTMGQVGNSIGGGENLYFIGRMKPRLTLEQAEARSQPTLTAFRRTFLPDAPPGYATELSPLLGLRAAEIRAPLVELFAAVALVLLIACANVAGLVLVRAATRGRELGIRLALGATRGRLTSQLLTESLVLALLGGAAGAVVARWGLSLLLPMAPTGVTEGADIRLDRWALLFAAGASLASGAVFGLTAAWRAARADLHGALKEGAERTTATAGVGRVRNALAVGEVSLSLVLLVGAGLLMQSMANLVGTNPGFEPSHVVAAEIWLTGTRYDSTAAIAAFYERLIQRLEAQPGIRSAAVIEAGIPLVRGGNLPAAVDGAYVQETTNYRTVTPGYFETMGIPLEQGRPFSATDVAGAEPVAAVSESFARRFLGAQPLERMVSVGGRSRPGRRVVGVVGDVRQYIGAAPMPTLFLPSAQTPAGLTRLFSSWFPIQVVVRTAGDPGAMRPVVERTIRATDAHVPVGRVRTMDEILVGSLSVQRFIMLVLSVFAALAMVLAAIGIYGVMSYLVTQRAHEIGVRVALGARAPDVLGLVLGRGLTLAAAGAALGLAGAVAVTRLMASQLYGVEPTDPLTLAAATVILILVALAACYVPARRATKVDPVVALKAE